MTPNEQQRMARSIEELSTRIAVVAEKRVIINAPVPEVLAFEHPFIQHYFLGGRGLRAMSLLPDSTEIVQ